MLNLYIATREYSSRTDKVTVRLHEVKAGESLVLKPDEAIFAQQFDYDDSAFPPIPVVKTEESKNA